MSVSAQRPAARNTPFQIQHVVEFGLLILQRDRITANICSVRCQFCIYNGKENAIGEKRKRAQTDIPKDWTIPFRTSKYRDHHVSQHRGTWEAYQKLTYDQKKDYFEDKVKHNDTIEKHSAYPKGPIPFIISMHLSLIRLSARCFSTLMSKTVSLELTP